MIAHLLACAASLPLLIFPPMVFRPQPLFFQPVYKRRIWGGRRIASVFSRDLPSGAIGESWEISDRDDGMSVIADGPLKGNTLSDLVRRFPEKIVGKNFKGKRFPLLVKILDASHRLSVQVHPDEHFARISGTEPKTEMWYILDSDPGSVIYAGLRKGTTAAALQAAIHDGTVADMLGKIPVSPHSAIFIPAGLVHAIGEGCLILEIQQNSDTTYRLFDWNRLGPDGKPRQLHYKHALASIRWDLEVPSLIRIPETDPKNGNSSAELVSCPYFRVTVLNLRQPYMLDHDGDSFSIVFAANGNLILSGNPPIHMRPGDSCLIPAAMSSCRLIPDGERVRVILAGLPASK